MGEQNRLEIWLILGPSGVGKSSFGEYLEHKHCWVHLDTDQYPEEADIIDVLKLRDSWDAFSRMKDAGPLRQELESRLSGMNGCAISFASTLVIPPEQIAVAADASIKVVYLYGSAADCINAFLKREKMLNRGLDLNHWLLHNRESYLIMSNPAFNGHRIQVFCPDGTRREWSVIFEEARSKIQ